MTFIDNPPAAHPPPYDHDRWSPHARALLGEVHRSFGEAAELLYFAMSVDFATAEAGVQFSHPPSPPCKTSLSLMASLRRPVHVPGKAQTGQLLVSWLLSTASIFVTASLVPGFIVKDFTHCVLAAVILGLVNAFARPTLEGFFTPVTSVSYALSMFLINAVLIWVAGNITPGMIVAGFMPAVLGSVVLTTVNTGLDSLIHQQLAA